MFAIKGETLADYWDYTHRIFDFGPAGTEGEGPNMILDDGGDATLLMHLGKRAENDASLIANPTSEEETGLLAAHLGCEGDVLDALLVPNFGTAGDRFSENYGVFGVSFDGREIFKRAVKGMAEETRRVLAELDMKDSDIDLIIPHQANERIIESLAKFMGVSMDKVVLNIAKYGNTSAATIPVALCEAIEDGRVKAGSHLLLTAFGAGLTRGAGLVRWGNRTSPLGTSDAELPPCNQTALQIMAKAIERTQGPQVL